MSDAQRLATSYLAPTVDAGWRWSGDGEVLTWADGKTIAFRAEVEAVLNHLAPHGLPPFGAVVLLLAACREGWGDSAGRQAVRAYGQFAGEPGGSRATTPDSRPRSAGRIGSILDGLDHIARLPARLRAETDAKTVLAEAVFEPAAKSVPPGDAALVVSALRDGVSPYGLLPQLSAGGRDRAAQLEGDLSALRPGLAAVDEQALALRVRTGLDQLVTPAEIDLAPADRVRRLLAELRADKELAGLAKLAQDLMAAVHVPRALGARDELPVGGVSDLSNRGPLDRLIVSELAHDDLTLAVRVATGEALYLRRESPPRRPPSRRAILIDAGIRLWGIPRVFAAAVALALVATADKKAELLTFRATATGIEAADLTTRAGLIDFLSALEPSPHPGAALRPFFDRLAREAADGLTDALLVTHPDVLADPDFAAAVGELEDPSLYVAAVARDGSFQLHSLSPAGRKLIREATLSLDAILEQPPAEAKKPAGTPLRVKDLDPALPVILSAEPFPLLLPYVVDPKWATVSKKHGLVAATKDGRLLLWTNIITGARQLTTLLPRGNVAGIVIDDESATAAVVIEHRRTTRTHLVTADLAGGLCTHFRLETVASESQGIWTGSGVLFVIQHSRIDAYRFPSGQFIDTLPVPEGLFWQGGRYVRVRDEWHAMTARGQTIHLEPIPEPARSRIKALAVFDRHGQEGPWVLRPDLRVARPDGSMHTAGKPPTRKDSTHVEVSPDGERLAVRTGGESFLLDLATGTWHAIPNSVEAGLLVPAIHLSTQSAVTARTDFSGVFAGSHGELWLRTKQGSELVAGMNERKEMILTERGRAPAPPAMRAFGRTIGIAGARFGLKVATWADGSRAFLDGRGLLHLKSADPMVPEITLVLSTMRQVMRPTEGKVFGHYALAGWSSEGKVFGPSFFIGGAAPTDTAYFDAAIRRFTGRLR